MTELLNAYKDVLEIDLIAKHGSPFIKRQKGQLKLDNSILEEFLVHLVHPAVIEGLPENLELTVGPTRAFMSLSFSPVDLPGLAGRPKLVIKTKDQDFVIGKNIHYRFSPDADFPPGTTAAGSIPLAVLAAECKVNLDSPRSTTCTCCGTQSDCRSTSGTFSRKSSNIEQPTR